MKSEINVEQLLRWRLAKAEAEAPPAPRAARLLELARPWWETWPERFQALVQRLGQLEITYGHAMAESRRAKGEYLVPALIFRNAEEMETTARLLYFNVRDHQMRLRFQLSATPECPEKTYEVTFVCRESSKAFSAPAALSMGSEYSLAASIPEDLAVRWERLKVTDEMPFRLILRPVESNG